LCSGEEKRDGSTTSEDQGYGHTTSFGTGHAKEEAQESVEQKALGVRSDE